MFGTDRFMRRMAGCVVFVLCVGGLKTADALAREKLDRGVVALRTADGHVYVGWRLLADDPADVGFHVYRRLAEGSETLRLTDEPLTCSTNFVDTKPITQGRPSYSVRPVTADGQGASSPWVPMADTPGGESYISIKLRGDDSVRMVAVGDLTGDGRLDYVVQRPDISIDPWQREGYWRPSPGTYKLEAYRHDGTFMWSYDMGWGIEQGNWYAPYVVYDLDGDGRAEVYAKAGEGDPRNEDGRVEEGPEWCVRIDGLTGEVTGRVPWPDRTGYRDYNWASRNMLGIAYLDGQNPSLIIQRGNYRQIKVDAYDGQLEKLWSWNSNQEEETYSGTGSHNMHAADVTGDGRDEIILGTSALKYDGHGLWTTPMHHPRQAHPDVCHVGNLDPSRPGLEIFLGFETPQPRDGVCMLDARTGEILWSYEGPTKHVHSAGMAGDILAEYPGQECYAGEQDGSQYWLYTADGKRIGNESFGTLRPIPVWWNADPQKEIIVGQELKKFGGPTFLTMEGRVLATADLFGDWREEILVALPGELRIYTTTIPAADRKICSLQDHLYRMGVVQFSTGYYYAPQLGGRLRTQTAP